MKEVRWRRYGHDRTYFESDDGQDLGWVDNLTGEVHPESDEASALITAWLARDQESANAGEPDEAPADAAAVSEIKESQANQLEASIVHSNETDVVVASDENSTDAQLAPTEWEDLALRRPGQAVREQARAELASNWESSKFRTAVRIAFDLHTDERAWRLGASGEIAIGARLEKLSDHGWRVLHSVPIGERGSDIDHIAIGPGGVWTINTKNHPGKKIWVAPRQIRVDGHTVPYLRNAEFEANRVRKILTTALGWEPHVRPALVFLTGTLVPEVTIKGNPENVDILDRMDVGKRLKREPVRMNAEQVEEVFAIARRSTTWVR